MQRKLRVLSAYDDRNRAQQEKFSVSIQSDKFELQLESAETRFRERLLSLLPDAAISGSNLFTNSHFNPSGLRPHHFRSDAEALLADARECIGLREKLDLPVQGSVGQLFLAACEENASKNAQRRGPRRLAESLLAQLSDAS
jgi:hypothetical protein